MSNLSKFIDHTFLKSNATKEDIERVCDEAIKHDFKGVCVAPKFLTLAKEKLKGKKTILISVVDFPSGEKSPKEKAKEAKEAIENGADELDMVLDVLALKDKNYQLVFEGIKAVVDQVFPLPVKVIIETCYLNYDEKVIACTLSKLAGAKFVKTSTGFGKGGATTQDVVLMKKIVGSDMDVKASGGIKTLDDAKLMITAGATRLGTSASLDLLS